MAGRVDTDTAFSDDEEFNDIIDSVTQDKELIENRTKGLTRFQKARIEKNKLKALTLKKSRLQVHPYSKTKTNEGFKSKTEETRLVDSGGGFFIEEEEESEANVRLTEEPPPVLPPDQPTCEECKKDFAESYLFKMFNYAVCDECKDMGKDGKHELITKTEAKNQFLLRDTDFEEGERSKPMSKLDFLLRKNPHNPRYGDMKLFLRVQVEQRAMEVWGSEEALEREHEKREETKMALKAKKYNKKMTELRKAVRSSLFTKDLSNHTHTFGEETYDAEKDEYSRSCDCGYVNTYEKM